jgi:hypothetical protein
MDINIVMYDRDKNKLVIFSKKLRPFISFNKEKSVFFRSCTEFNDDDTRNTETMTQQKEAPVEQIEIEQKETQQSQAQFSPGSIHSEEVREFWKKELTTNEWVMLTLKEGYVIPFKEFPPKYEEPNNASAIREMTFTYETVLELKNSGVVKFTNEKPHCVSPLTVIQDRKRRLNQEKTLFGRIAMHKQMHKGAEGHSQSFSKSLGVDTRERLPSDLRPKIRLPPH